MVKKAGNEIAVRREASLAARAWERLEASAKATMNGGPAPSMQLVANTDGIVAHIRDMHGTDVVVEHGRISVSVATPAE